MYMGSAIVRRSPLAEKVCAKARELRNKPAPEPSPSTVERIDKPEAIKADKAPMPLNRVMFIKAAVANEFGVTIDEIMSHRRTPQNLVSARQVAMFLSDKHTTQSLPQIGRAFGRDHTTVLHGKRKIAEELLSKRELQEKVRRIEFRLSAAITTFVYWGA